MRSLLAGCARVPRFRRFAGRSLLGRVGQRETLYVLGQIRVEELRDRVQSAGPESGRAQRAGESATTAQYRAVDRCHGPAAADRTGRATVRVPEEPLGGTRQGQSVPDRWRIAVSR